MDDIFIMIVKEKLMPHMLVASATHMVKKVSDELIEQFTKDLEIHLDETGADIIEPQNFFTVFHVNAYREADYEMELWTEVESIRKNTENITFKSIPENNVAYVLVSENYENLQFAYEALFDYIHEHRYLVDGYPRETYIFDNSAPLGYFTEIQLPFIRKSHNTNGCE